MITTTKAVTIVGNFVNEVVEGINKSFQREVEEYAENMKQRIITEAMKQLNNVRCDVVQAMGKSGIEFRIVVELQEPKVTER